MQQFDTIPKLKNFLNDNTFVEEIAVQSLVLTEIEDVISHLMRFSR